MNILKFGIYSWKPRFWFRNCTQVIRNIKFAWQRIIRGYADADTWNLDSYLAELISNSVKTLNENNHGHPSELTEEKWTNILNDISNYFKNSLEDGNIEFNKKVEEAYEKSRNHITNSCTIHLPDNKFTIKYYYDNEEDYKKDTNAWLKLEQDYYNYRVEQLNKGLDLLKKYWFNLWD